MICIPPVTSGIIVPVWYLLSAIINSAGRGISTNPFNTWIIESCKDNSEYRSLAAIPFTVGGILGALFGGLLVAFIPAVAAVAGVIGYGISTFLIVYYIPSVVRQHVAKLPPLIPSFRIASRTNEFRTIFTNRVLIQSATGIFGSAASLLLITGFNLGTNNDFVTYSILLAIIGVIGILIANVSLNWLLRYVEKLRVYLSRCSSGCTITGSIYSGVFHYHGSIDCFPDIRGDSFGSLRTDRFNRVTHGPRSDSV
jgi:hypothetical protein